MVYSCCLHVSILLRRNVSFLHRPRSLIPIIRVFALLHNLAGADAVAARAEIFLCGPSKDMPCLYHIGPGI